MKKAKPPQQKIQTGILVSASARRLVRQLLADDTVRDDLVLAGERCSQSGVYERALGVYAESITAGRGRVEALSPAALANQIASLSAALALALNSPEPAQNAQETAQMRESEPEFDPESPGNAPDSPMPGPGLPIVPGKLAPGPAIANPFVSPVGTKSGI